MKDFYKEYICNNLVFEVGLKVYVDIIDDDLKIVWEFFYLEVEV